MEIHSKVDLVSCICILLVWTTSNADEGLLMLARAGGRYDPLQLWFSSPRSLWAVNQCAKDETDSFRNHSIKGNFRSPTIDNLTSYNTVELELVVYSGFGDELLNVKGCEMMDENRTLQCDDKIFGKVIGAELDRMGGFVLKTETGDKMLTMMYDSTYYFNNATTRECLLLSSSNRITKPPNTGYEGCHDVVQDKVFRMDHMSLETCLKNCTKFATIKNPFCGCLETFEGKHQLDDRKCSFLCLGNNNQTCGGDNATSVYDVTSYMKFKKFTENVDTGETKLASAQVTDSNSTIVVPPFSSKTYVTRFKVEEDTECSFTNIYFNVSGPKYNVIFDEDCKGLRNTSRTVHGREEMWQAGPVLACRVMIEPIPHNCTFHKSAFTFYGTSATSDVFDVGRGYIGIRGRWSNETQTTTTTSTTPETSTSVTTIDTTTSETSTTQTTGGHDKTPAPRSTSSPQHVTNTSLTGMLTTTQHISLTSSHQGETTQEDSPTKSTDAYSSTSRTTTQASSAATSTDLNPNVTSPAPAMKKACTCLCKSKPLKKNQTKVMAAKEKAIKIQKELKVDTMNLSSSVRKKVSAPDSRTTAAVGGYLGICLLTIALGSLILADITSITRHIQLLRRNISGPSPPVKKIKK
ncbi:serine-rich adhesin for platelets-like [Haliotis cracherodii]|uniref:serine-rich adhesin for platelets-like n=1 Tax=Haliotis cracherodii TaxID=6455 RepID=UPI0039E79558